MATTRKIKEAKDLSSGELIYFKGHAKATYMTDGRTVEDAINNINQSGSGAYPIVSYVKDGVEYGTTVYPNKFYLFSSSDISDGSMEYLSISLGEEIEGIVNEYLFQFTSGSEPTVFSLPNSIVWANDEIPIIESGYTYQISIVNNCATYLKFRKL